MKIKRKCKICGETTYFHSNIKSRKKAKRIKKEFIEDGPCINCDNFFCLCINDIYGLCNTNQVIFS